MIANAQTYTVQGFVYNKSKAPLSGIKLTVATINTNTTITGVTTTTTNAQGYYKFNFNRKSSSSTAGVQVKTEPDACGREYYNEVSTDGFNSLIYQLDFRISDYIVNTLKTKIILFNEDSIPVDTLKPKVKGTSHSFPNQMSSKYSLSYNNMIVNEKHQYSFDIPCCDEAQIICDAFGYYYVQVDFKITDTVLKVYLQPMPTNIEEVYKYANRQLTITKSKPIVIYSLSGQKIYSKTPKIGEVIDLSQLSPGIYIVNNKKKLIIF